MNSLKVRIGFVLATGLLAGASFAQDTYNLRQTRVVDALTKYQMSSEFEMQGQKIALSLIGTDKVTKVSETGYTLETSQADLIVTVDGKAVPADPGTKAQTISYLANGVPAEFDESTSEDQIRARALLSFVSPDAAVKVGEKWEVKAKTAKSLEFTFSGELLALEKVEEADALKVRLEVTERTAGATSKSSSTYWLSPKDFSVIKAEGKVLRATAAGNADPYDFNFKMEALADA